MVKIGFSMRGPSKKKTFRIVAKDSKKPRDSGKILEYLGFYDPHKKETNIFKFKDRIDRLIILGAVPTTAVKNLILRSAKNRIKNS